MRIGELAQQAGVTVKAVRYYESLGLVTPARLGNGYRDYGALDVQLVREIRALGRLGIPARRTRPFLDCLAAGHAQGDDCPSSLASYRDAISELTEQIGELTARRDALRHRLDEAAGRDFPPAAAASPSGRDLPTPRASPAAGRDFSAALPAAPPLPPDLPVPVDDGAADRIAGRPVPPLTLPSTAGPDVALDALGSGRTVLYVYPLTGRPGVDVPDGWDAIPGARGCTNQACDFRDHHAELRAAGADGVFGLSSQDTAYQRELSDRLRLPFAVLSDPSLELADRLGLPTFTAGGARLYRRLTLVVTAGAIEHVFYPVFPPDRHAEQVLDWLASGPR